MLAHRSSTSSLCRMSGKRLACARGRAPAVTATLRGNIPLSIPGQGGFSICWIRPSEANGPWLMVADGLEPPFIVTPALKDVGTGAQGGKSKVRRSDPRLSILALMAGAGGFYFDLPVPPNICKPVRTAGKMETAS
ncbi:hypothetical protein BRAS3809_330002 [Bradyrhizobium sp. STM 3809]|nr:hypothetical protein BRAS3809_330002 [Bradyrhizobium sp. STM 3809]